MTAARIPAGPARTAHAPILSLSIDRAGATPAYVQLYEQLRGLILTGRLKSRDRLPATRALAGELGLSRGTVVAAYDQLASEGYIDGRVGSGAYVAAFVPEHLLPSRGNTAAAAAPAPRVDAGRAAHPPFHPASAALDQFPHQEWARAFLNAWRDPPLGLLDNPDPQGVAALRAAIAQHLKAWRGIDCAPEQVFVLSGTAEALELVAQALVPRGAPAWLEDPGYPIAFRVLESTGLKPVAVRVDAEGFDVAAALRQEPRARLAVITPSHQYPLGYTMTLARRLTLLDWAARGEGWIVEDDYASEYRYSGRPLAALAGLDKRGRVLYCGTFSKVLFPALRLAYLVAPAAVVPRLRAAQLGAGARASTIAQVPLAQFIASGQFAAHIRRMRRLYAGRQQALVRAIESHCTGLLEATPAEAGMHLIARLSPSVARRMDDAQASARAAGAGVSAPALSSYSRLPRPPQGLALGYAGFDEAAMDAAARKLAAALERRG